MLFEEKHKLTDNAQLPYCIPEEPTAKDQKNHEKNASEPLYYRSKIEAEFPLIERPEVFGQHINAEIQSQIADTNALIDSIISLSPQIGASGEESRESKVQHIIKELLEKLPDELDM